MLQTICDVIILISAVILALTNIGKFFGKPLTFLQKKQNEELKEKIRENIRTELPKILLEEDSVLTQDKILPILSEIKENVLKQNDRIEILAKSSLDILREKIMGIYYKNKNGHTLTIHESERLEQYYKDYKAEGGNSYIDKYYERMSTWEIIEEDN